MESQSIFLPQAVDAAVREIVDYLWREESRDYREYPSTVHVYLRLRHVRLWLQVLDGQKQEGAR